jgi:hypothetical protein
MHNCEFYPDELVQDNWYENHEDFSGYPWPEMRLHTQAQDTTLPAWRMLLELIEEAVADRREVFAPRKDLGSEAWAHITTLPRTIERLTAVKEFDLYRSSLLSIPVEIGAMTSLEKFTPYTSYGLHWFPYEITRCKNLRASTVSTRALYGNYKYRQPFPLLDQQSPMFVPERCSVCAQPMAPHQVLQRWISLPVATDVLPLLVNACSVECLGQLPMPPSSYVQAAHSGGTRIVQPPAER